MFRSLTVTFLKAIQFTVWRSEGGVVSNCAWNGSFSLSNVKCVSLLLIIVHSVGPNKLIQKQGLTTSDI